MKGFPGTAVLLTLLVAAFVLEAARGAVGNEHALLSLGALPDDGTLRGEYWRLVTYGLLHLTTLHLAVNAAGLYWVGRLVERRIGTAQMLLVFSAAVVAGGMAIALTHARSPHPGATVGASGGLFGLLAVGLVLAYRHGVRVAPLSRTARRVLWAIAVGGLAASALPGLSMAGHLGGLAAGSVGGLLARPR